MSLLLQYTDNQLLDLLRENDTASFNEIYNRYWATIYRNAFKILGSADDAEDVVQELFASLWERRKSIMINSALSAYLYTSAKYISLRIIQKNIQKYSYKESLSQALDPVFNPVVESQLDANNLEITIDNIVNTLPEKMKEVFLLSRKEHLSHKEIAEKMNISEETVKKQIYNALKVIRQTLGSTVSLGCIVSCIYAITL
ncbi:MAG: RNA polymerase sigma-70 factor [Arachidicoccus sp.]|nr:RNA polymerase sigma-70 factor [Arachidicoccus sp.]